MKENTIKSNNALVVKVIPEWIHSTLSRKGYSPDQMFNLSVVSDELSIDDMASLLGVNNSNACSGFFTISHGNFNDFVVDVKCTEEQQPRISTAISLSYSDHVALGLKTQLEYVEDSSASTGVSAECKCYKHIAIGSNVYLVVARGFAAALKDKDQRLSFLRDHLKVLHNVVPEAVVSRTDAYRQYVLDVTA